MKTMKTLLITTIALILFGANLTVAAEAVFQWSPNSETNLAGYNIYIGKESRSYTNQIDVGSPSLINDKVVAAVDNLVPGKTYYFAATAYDTDGFESDYSQEVVWTAPAAVILPPLPEPPAPPDFGAAGGPAVFTAQKNMDGTYTWYDPAGIELGTAILQ